MPTASSLRVKIASEPWEFDQIHALNHETFTGEIPQHPASASGRLVDRFHDDNVYVIGVDGRRVAGMIAIRDRRPFSLDQRLPGLDRYLPGGRAICELRLLAVDKNDRRSRLLPAMFDYVWRYCLHRGFDLALISGTTRQLKLYAHLGFVPFGPLVGSGEALFQPMMVTLERFAPRAPKLFRAADPPSRRAPVNFLPGPVTVRDEVRRAFEQPPASHRAAEFVADLEGVRTSLRTLTGARRVAILLGSGTIANDVVAAQLSLERAPGVILTNGEFGDRLVDHARRVGLSFEVMRQEWGDVFDAGAVARRLASAPRPGWVWMVHCETSTGVLNDLDGMKTLCASHAVKLCADTISAIGNVPIDLTGVHFACGVSGKGLGSYPGLALVLHHHDIEPAAQGVPRYLDLGLYAADCGVPFTHSSNLLGALGAALGSEDWPARFAQLAEASAWLRARLTRLGFSLVAPEQHAAPGVVTIAMPSSIDSVAMANEMEQDGFLLSANSRYLIERNWLQICPMSRTTVEDLAAVSNALYQRCCREHASA